MVIPPSWFPNLPGYSKPPLSSWVGNFSRPGPKHLPGQQPQSLQIAACIPRDVGLGPARLGRGPTQVSWFATRMLGCMVNRSIAVKLGDGVKRQLMFQGPLLYGPLTQCGNSIYHSENSIYHSDFSHRDRTISPWNGRTHTHICICTCTCISISICICIRISISTSISICICGTHTLYIYHVIWRVVLRWKGTVSKMMVYGEGRCVGYAGAVRWVRWVGWVRSVGHGGTVRWVRWCGTVGTVGTVGLQGYDGYGTVGPYTVPPYQDSLPTVPYSQCHMYTCAESSENMLFIALDMR